MQLRNYALVTAGYWAFTITDGALRLLVLLYFHDLGYSPVSLAFLFLLPSQKAHVRELASRPRSPMAGVFMGLLLLVLVVVGTVFAVLPIVPSLACLRIAGGTGCSGSD